MSPCSLCCCSRTPLESPRSDPLTNHLPLEICARIFYYVLPSVDLISKAHEYDPMNHKSSPRISSIPLLLSQVSRKWRAICHSTPNLWTVLVLYLGGKTSATTSVALEDTLEWTWATHAGSSLPLSIILCKRYTNDPVVPTSHSYFMLALIATYAPRICYLQANISKHILEELCRVYRDRSRLQTLRMFTFARRGAGALDYGPPFRPSVLDATRTSWKHIAIDTSLLTHVEVTDVFFQEWMDLLASSPLLVSCTLNNPQHFSASPPPVPWTGGYDCTPLIYPHLKSFAILHVKSQLVIPQILSKLTLPALDSLALQPTRKNQQDMLSSVLGHLRQSGSSLRSLTFSHLRLHTAGDCARLAELLASVSSTLHSLTLVSPMLCSAHKSRDPTCQEQLSALFKDTLPRLLCLRELTVRCSSQSSHGEWLFLLWTLLKSSLSFAMAPNSDDVLSVILWSSKSPLVDLTSGQDSLSSLPLLTAVVVQEMLDAIQHPRVHLKIKCADTSPESEDIRGPVSDIDVSAEVIAALCRLVAIQV